MSSPKSYDDVNSSSKDKNSLFDKFAEAYVEFCIKCDNADCASNANPSIKRLRNRAIEAEQSLNIERKKSKAKNKPPDLTAGEFNRGE